MCYFLVRDTRIYILCNRQVFVSMYASYIYSCCDLVHAVLCLRRLAERCGCGTIHRHDTSYLSAPDAFVPQLAKKTSLNSFHVSVGGGGRGWGCCCVLIRCAVNYYWLMGICYVLSKGPGFALAYVCHSSTRTCIVYYIHVRV